LTGCAVGPKYHRPTVELQPFHNGPSIETRTTSLPAPPLDQWWTGFRDPELTRIVKRALDDNLDLAAAMTRVQQARAAAQGAGAQGCRRRFRPRTRSGPSAAVASEGDDSAAHSLSRSTAEPARRSDGRPAGNARSGVELCRRHSRCA